MRNTTNRYTLTTLRSVKKRGNVMAMVLATIFVLTTIVVSFHHQQTVARASLTRSEAELRFRESKNFALREHFLGESSPWGLAIGVELEDRTPESTKLIEKDYAQNLFQRDSGTWSGLPDLRAEGTAHSHRYLTVEASGFGGLSSGVKKGAYKVVETDIPGYAAYAPNGSIRTGDVLGWQNPDHQQDDGSTHAYSGVPAVLAAQGDITVEELAYGEAHSQNGDIAIEDGRGIGFTGALPLTNYHATLSSELHNARSTLSGSTSTGNKTRLINEHTTLADILSIMFGGNFNPERLLSLRQATHFPTPMIPGGSMVVPGVVWEVWLHVPFQPDLGFSSKHDPDLSRLDEIAQENEEAGVLLKKAREKIQETQQALEQAEAAYASHPTEANEEAVEKAQDDHNDALTKFRQIKDFLAESSAEAGAIANGKIGSGISSLPETRREDPRGKDGQWGWNYSETMARMFGLVVSIAKDRNFRDAAASISADVRVVHYGPEDEVPGFEWTGNTFLSRSTWTVPASRTLRFDGDMEIQGDLWLQRGTVMMVNGDVRVAAPNGETPSLTDSFRPSGRVFFEEGSTLIVSGDFECEGSPQFGSIMVGGEPGEIHPITSGLFVDGDIRIPNGIYAGHTIPDLIGALGLPGVEAGTNTVHNLLSEQAPLLSKLAGPFHMRNPYFARYATTFQLVTIPFPPAIAVTPIPSPKENLHVFAFRAETFAYTAGLNATLGENLYTQADWWPFGTGVVPMSLNLDLGEALIAAGKVPALLDSAELDPERIETEVRDFVDVLGERSIQWAIDKGLQKLTEEAARILTPGGLGPINDAIQDVVGALENDENAADRFYQEFVRGFESRIGDLGEDLISDLLESANVENADEYLKEYAGLLVHGRNIFVSEDARQVSGMFVAERDIIIEAELTVGTLVSLDGSIEVGDFLYYPYFNQASLYIPNPTPGTTPLERAVFQAYGESNDSGMAVQVGPPSIVNSVTSGGWER